MISGYRKESSQIKGCPNIIFKAKVPTRYNRQNNHTNHNAKGIKGLVDIQINNYKMDVAG